MPVIRNEQAKYMAPRTIALELEDVRAEADETAAAFTKRLILAIESLAEDRSVESIDAAVGSRAASLAAERIG